MTLQGISPQVDPESQIGVLNFYLDLKLRLKWPYEYRVHSVKTKIDHC